MIKKNDASEGVFVMRALIFWVWLFIVVYAAPGVGYGATLSVDTNGTLLGASDVKIAGRRHYVNLLGGTCDSVFSGCRDEVFAFDTAEGARAAAQALLDQVYVDGPEGNFDTGFNITGCAAYYVNCFTRVPYASVGLDQYLMATAFNVLVNDFVLLEGPFTSDNGPFLNLNFARFAPVPLPPGHFLLLVALGALVLWPRDASRIRAASGTVGKAALRHPPRWVQAMSRR